MAEENNLPKDISNLEDENVTEEEQQDNHPPAPKRAKVVWQETLIALVAAQQKQLSEMTEITRHSKMATGPTPSTSATGEGSAQALANTSFRLSEFNPESSDYAIEEWLDIATKLKAELHIGDVLMIAKAGEALKGSAHRYYCDWRPVHRTWDEFCKDLIVAFPDRETPGARAFTAATLRSRDCESLSDYGIRKLRSINRFHRDLPWNTILSMVEYGLDHGEAQATIRMHQPTGDRELLKILSEFDARRRKQRVVQNQSSRSTDVSILQLGINPRLVATQQFLGDAPTSDHFVDPDKAVADARVRMQENTKKHAHRFDATRFRSSLFLEGDKVAVEDSQLAGGGKLKAKYKGPYTVSKRLPNERYLLTKKGQRTTVAAHEQLRSWPSTETSD
ncbi:hypothetical protein TcasGA2_TC031345 [Tribolium castaneum]|uniref:Retrotransposon gag domain-containing protein n=1 Tax=Tribolium castaneum TaxID=7070 RepID=A0A139W9L0_TRICA|nr:hypothetical protein TcasGA2_TC031345 [Tribolium castaneum]